jgi:hypothetical protein
MCKKATRAQLEGAEPPGLLDDEIVWLAEVEATVEIAGVEEDMGLCPDESESGAGHLDTLATPPVLSDTRLKDPSWSTTGVLDGRGPRSTRTTAKDLAPTLGEMSPAWRQPAGCWGAWPLELSAMTLVTPSS